MPGPRRLAPFRGRVAYPSYVDESLFGNPHQDTVRKARSMPDASAFPTVLGAAEYGCMEVRARAQGELTEKQQDKARLHALSNARKAKWPNTLEANRIKKEKSRQDKLDAEEALRKEIDAEEEALHVEKRRLAIERANKMLYDSTDRVKSLHSKLLLADVMQERERQLELKKVLKGRELATEERFYQKQQEAIRRMDAEEDLRDEEEEEKRKLVAKVREAQVAQQRQIHNARLAEIKREGEVMAQKAVADLEQEKRQRVEALEHEQKIRAEFVEANKALLGRREAEQAFLEEEEDRMLEYATLKEADLLMRRAKEEERFAARQAQRQKMIDEGVRQLADLNASTNNRLEAQALEVANKAAEARAKLDEKKKNELLVTHMSRQQQMRWKRERKAQEDVDDKHIATTMKALNIQLREEEADKIRDNFERAKARDAYLLRQMADKTGRAEQEKEEEMYEAEQIKQWMGDDDAIFDQYAQMCLDEWVAQGKNPKPMELVLQKQRSTAGKLH